jgi:hypothetical protein
MRPNEDIDIARRRHLRFYVSRKEKRGAPWTKTFATEDIDLALERARTEDDYEVAVFVETASGGFIYWTSKHPDVFNSTVLEIE